jgi:hypothetical protein
MIVAPDANAVVAMGANPHDRSSSTRAAGAGFNQGQSEADRLRELWS